MSLFEIDNKLFASLKFEPSFQFSQKETPTTVRVILKGKFHLGPLHCHFFPLDHKTSMVLNQAQLS
jgi:hypothetical protein